MNLRENKQRLAIFTFFLLMASVGESFLIIFATPGSYINFFQGFFAGLMVVFMPAVIYLLAKMRNSPDSPLEIPAK